MIRYPLYVPAVLGALKFIDKGAAIVGPPDASDDPNSVVTIYFESNRYGAENVRTLAARALHAAGRLRQRYPTIAKAAVKRGELVLVGFYTYDADQRGRERELGPIPAHVDVRDPETLIAWCGTADPHAPLQDGSAWA